MAYRGKSAKSRSYRARSTRGRKTYTRGKRTTRSRSSRNSQQTVKIIVETAGPDAASAMQAMGYTSGTAPSKRKAKF